jgi:hypothetical protein
MFQLCANQRTLDAKNILKIALNWKMFHIVYQHSWVFNLETLLMLGIFNKWPPNWKMLSTIYQYSKQVDLISNCIILLENEKIPNET